MGAIVLDNVRCTGTEARLVDCPSNALGVHNCIHAEDASVRCNQTRNAYTTYSFLMAIWMHVRYAQPITLYLISSSLFASLLWSFPLNGLVANFPPFHWMFQWQISHE